MSDRGLSPTNIVCYSYIHIMLTSNKISAPSCPLSPTKLWRQIPQPMELFFFLLCWFLVRWEIWQWLWKNLSLPVPERPRPQILQGWLYLDENWLEVSNVYEMTKLTEIMVNYKLKKLCIEFLSHQSQKTTLLISQHINVSPTLWPALERAWTLDSSY